MVSLPRCLSEALYSLQLRMRYVAFFFIARKAYHVTASATLHSDSCNKARADETSLAQQKFAHRAFDLRAAGDEEVVVSRGPDDHATARNFAAEAVGQIPLMRDQCQRQKFLRLAPHLFANIGREPGEGRLHRKQRVKAERGRFELVVIRR